MAVQRLDYPSRWAIVVGHHERAGQVHPETRPCAHRGTGVGPLFNCECHSQVSVLALLTQTVTVNRRVDMGYVLVVTAVVGLAVGFAGGFLTFKRSHAWCRECGGSLRCLECAGQPKPHRVREVLRAGWQR